MAFPVTLNGRTYTLTDFEGTNYVDGLPDAFEDFVTHAGDIYNSTSTTSNSIGTGSKTFTVEANKPYQAGTPLRIADAAAPSTNFLDTVVTSYSGTTLVVNSIGYGGSGTKTSWTVNIGGAKTIDGTLGLSQGGTGATDAAGARTNIDVYSKADADSRFLNVSGEASDVTMTGNVTIGDGGSDLLTVNDAMRVSGTNPEIKIDVGSSAYHFLLTEEYSGDRAIAHLKSVAGTSFSGQFQFNANSSGGGFRELARMDYANGAIFNESGADLDFRVESDAATHAFFVDAGNSRVGINKSTPSYTFDVEGVVAASHYMRVDSNSGVNGSTLLTLKRNGNTAGDYLQMRDGSNNLFASFDEGGIIFNEQGGDTDFRVESDSQANMLKIDAGLDTVIIGGGSPVGNPYFSLQGEASNDAGEVKVRTNGYNAFKFRNSSNANVGSITINASSTSYNTTSDRRLKTDIQAINDATDRLMAMNPVSHKWIAEPDADAVIGFIAQEMEGIIPEAVSGESDAEDMMGMDYGRITPVIVAALQEAITKIETLEARITALESN